QVPEVGHRAVRPKKRVGLAGGGQAGAHDLPGVVDAGGATARPTQRAEIGDRTILPPAGAPGSGAARANDLAGVIYRGHGDLTDIGHHAVRPHEAVHLAGGRLAVACNLAGVVDVTRRATGSAHRSELAVARDGFPVVAGLGRTVEGSGSTRSHAASARHTATTSGKTRIRTPPGRHSHETATLQNAAMRVPGRATPRCAERARASDHSPC